MNGQLIQYITFGLLALITLVGALRVASARSIMHAAFWLFPVFAGIAGFYLFLGAQFLAAIQVLIYIGAILVLIIFAVTLTRNPMDPEDAQNNRFAIPMALSAAAMILALAGAMTMTAWPKPFADISGLMLASNVAVTDVTAIGLTLLRQYLLPFEISSVLLLAAMIGAIVLARKERAGKAEIEPMDDPCETDAEEKQTAQV